MEKTTPIQGQHKLPDSIFTGMGIILTIFLLYTVYFGEFTISLQRGFPLLLTTILIFMKYPVFKKQPQSKIGLVINIICIAATILSLLYLIIFYNDVVHRIGFETTLDLIAGIIGILVVLEAARRTTGLAIPIIALVFMIYALFGGSIPGYFGHRGFSLMTIVRYVFYGGDGILGTALGVMTSYVYVILVFGALLQVSGAAKFFLDAAISITGRMRSGPAQAAVIGSSLFGTVSGSAAANVVGTGTFTIPLMKKYGYEPHFAASVEAVASSGGQLMPPVMGAASFLMAEYLNVSYLEIIIAALIPAILYYFALFCAVHFEACRLGLKPVPKEERINVAQALKTEWVFMLPILLFIVILVQGYSVGRAAFYAIVLLVIITFVIRKETRLKFGLALDTTKEAVDSSLAVWGALSSIGIIIGVVSMTGFGNKFAEVVLQVAGAHLIFALILTMLASLIMGMGLPTIACYVLLVIICAPALAKLGVPLLVSHMFVFYYGIISAITPPVALASYCAAGIAQCSPVKASVTAMRLGATAFILPFYFVFSPQLLCIGTAPEITQAVISAIIGVVALAAAIIGFLFKPVPIWGRACFVVASFLLIDSGTLTDIIGIAIIAAMVIINKFFTKDKSTPKPVTTQ